MRPFSARRHRPAGFTLIEAALATVIVGVGVVGLLQFMATGTVANVDAAETSTGMNLAQNIHELSLETPFASLPSLHGTTYSPPVDSRGETLADFDEWSQVIAVRPVDPDHLENTVTTPSPTCRCITVTVLRHGSQVCASSWYAFKPAP